MIQFGILNATPILCTVFDQLGVSYKAVTSEDKLTDLKLIVSNTPKNDRSLIEFIKNGGTAVDLTGSLLKQVKIKYKSQFCLSKKFSELPVPSEHEQVDLFCNVKYVKNQPCSIQQVGSGTLAHFGIPLEKTIGSTKVLRKQFPIPFRRNPAEELSAVSKGGILRLFESLLKELCFRQKIPYIQKANYDGTNPPLLFRIDSDFASKESVINWNKKATDAGIRTTWFLHTEAHESWLDLFKSFTEDEIALHCYEHVANNSLEDMQKGYELLKNQKLTPKGYCAPYGIWKPFINSTAKKLGILYSSDFELIYDSLPLLSIPSESDSILQIPIHPLCINNFTSYNVPDELIESHFMYRVAQQFNRNSAIALYDHLAHDKTELMLSILTQAKELGSTPTTFIEYATFWKKRISSELIVDNNLKVISSSVPVWIWQSHNEYSRWDNGESKNLQRQYIKEEFPDKYVQRINPKLFYISFLNRKFWRKYR